MGWLALLLFAGLALRAVILLLIPGTACLALDAEGFEHGHVFYRVRRPWRDVSDFRIETVNWSSRIGGLLKQIAYEMCDPGAGRRGAAPVMRVMPHIYGLRRDDFVRLLNAWRERALAPAT